MRRQILAALALVMVAAKPAPAQKPDYAKAHAMAARCMIFSSQYGNETHARAAFDAWKRLGELQGLTNRQLNGELDVLTKWETRRLHDDAVYRAQTRADCRALG